MTGLGQESQGGSWRCRSVESSELARGVAPPNLCTNGLLLRQEAEGAKRTHHNKLDVPLRAWNANLDQLGATSGTHSKGGADENPYRTEERGKMETRSRQ